MVCETTLAEARAKLNAAKSVVFLTGAGISAECGIPTFRDGDGLWSKYPPEVFGNLRGLLTVARLQPQLFACFLYDFIEPLVTAEPGPAHSAIAGLQATKAVTVFTQNVDGLHQHGGSENVQELHGAMFETVNLISRRVRTLSRDQMKQMLDQLDPLRLRRSGKIRLFRAMNPVIRMGLSGLWIPNVVLFGQSLPKKPWAIAHDAIGTCDCMVVVGTSRTVMPAAGLVTIAENAGATIIHVDPEAGGEGLSLTGTASELVPRLCDNDGN